MKIYTKEWYNQNDKSTEELAELLQKYDQLTENSNIPKEFKTDFHMHDAMVEKFFWDGDDLVVIFDTTGSASIINEVRFKKTRIKENDGICIGDFWVYEEIYSCSDKYELHVLFTDNNNYPKDFIIIFEDALFSYDEEKKKRQQEFLEKVKKHRIR